MTNHKELIELAIKAFSGGDLAKNLLNLFSALGYDTNRQNPLDQKTYAYFANMFLSDESSKADRKSVV